MTLRALLFALLFAIPLPWSDAFAQDLPTEEPAPAGTVLVDPAPTLPTFTTGEIEMRVYTPQKVDAHFLYQAVKHTHGRHFFVRENGRDQEPPFNIRVVGSSLLIFDEPENAKRVLKALTQLDSEASMEAPQGRKHIDETDLELWEYTPRYRAMHSLADALRPLQRTNLVRRDADDSVTQVDNLTYDDARLVVRDLPASVQHIRELMERIDVPAPHVTLSVLVLRASHEQGSPGLPEELTMHLSSLVPYDHFQLVTTGLVTTAVTPDLELMVNMDVDSDWSYMLEMRGEAYDTESGALTLRELRFREIQGGSTATVFATRATINAGEYVVLGAAGPEPIFAVIRMTAGGSARGR